MLFQFSSFCTLFLIFVLYFQSNTVFAQYNIRTQYIRTSAASSIDQQVNQSGNGYDLALGYWFRLKNLRIEFLPEVSYGNTILKADENSDETDITSFGFAFPIALYPFEIRGDCKCPTFSKQNDLVKKGFFMEVVPAFQQFQVARSGGSGSSWSNQINLGAGIGLDFGISDFVTLTPLVHYFTYIYSGSTGDQPTFKNQFRIGTRIMFRLDYR